MGNVLYLCKQAVSALCDRFPYRRHQHAARGALEQWRAQTSLQRAEVFGDGRLADVEFLRGAGDAAVAGDQPENMERVEVEVFAYNLHGIPPCPKDVFAL